MAYESQHITKNLYKLILETENIWTQTTHEVRRTMDSGQRQGYGISLWDI